MMRRPHRLYSEDMLPRVWRRLAAQIMPRVLEAQAESSEIRALNALLAKP